MSLPEVLLILRRHERHEALRQLTDLHCLAAAIQGSLSKAGRKSFNQLRERLEAAAEMQKPRGQSAGEILSALAKAGVPKLR